MGAFTGCAEFGLALLSLKLKAQGEPEAWVGSGEELAGVLKAQGASAIEINAKFCRWTGSQGDGPVALSALGGQVSFWDHAQPGIELPVGA